MRMQAIGGKIGQAAALCLMVHVLGLTAWAAYEGGGGTADDPYLIATAEQLCVIGTQPADWDKHFRLTADIDLSGYSAGQFNRIGTPDDGPFTGVFDGNDHTISNFRWCSDWTRYVGLFGFVEGEQARIMNVMLVDPNVAVEEGQYVGSLVGYIRMGTVANCHVRGGWVSGGNMIGGLIGMKDMATVTDCNACATVRGASRVGGLVGRSYWGLTQRCQAAATVSGCTDSECWAVGGLIGESQNGVVLESHATCTVEGSRYVGGLIGSTPVAQVSRCWADGVVSGWIDVGGLIGANDGGTVSDCYALAQVRGTVQVAGLIGRHGADCHCTVYEPGHLRRCFAAGPIVSPSNPGGLVALNEKSIIEQCLWDTQATGCAQSAGGSPRTTVEMQDLATYLREGWDFEGEKDNGANDIWSPPLHDSYPRLAWQALVVDLDCTARPQVHDDPNASEGDDGRH